MKCHPIDSLAGVSAMRAIVSVFVIAFTIVLVSAQALAQSETGGGPTIIACGRAPTCAGGCVPGCGGATPECCCCHPGGGAPRVCQCHDATACLAYPCSNAETG